jgi:multidrug resistance efflux pump
LRLLKAGAWEPDKAIARAEIAQAQAQIEQIQTDIDRALVRSPVAGRVLQVNVRPGEYVGASPGQSLMVLGDNGMLHVRVDIDEADVPGFGPAWRPRLFSAATVAECHSRFPPGAVVVPK